MKDNLLYYIYYYTLFYYMFTEQNQQVSSFTASGWCIFFVLS